MLLQIRDYVQRERVVSQQQLARQFQLAEEALSPMLDFWIRKGVLIRCNAQPGCIKKCRSCKPNLPIYYQFVVPEKIRS